MNEWYNMPVTTANASKSVFTAFIEGEGAVRNYLVPAGGMVILIDLNGNKMWFKSTDVNGVPSPIRVFNIKEIPQAVEKNPNVVTRQEFNALSQKIDVLLNALQGKTQPTEGVESK